MPTSYHNLDTVYETDEEEFGGDTHQLMSVEQAVEYETDEDEFDGGAEPSILPGGSRPDTTLAVPAMGRQAALDTRPEVLNSVIHQSTATFAPVMTVKKSRVKRMNVKWTGYFLGYFSLWWNRMEREARRDKEERVKEEMRHGHERRLRLMLDIGPGTRVDMADDNTTNEMNFGNDCAKDGQLGLLQDDFYKNEDLQDKFHHL